MSDDIQDEVRIPLSLLVERLSAGRRPNESFVRDLAAWLSERTQRLSLDAVEALGLIDVVMTFRMKHEVTLVVTGRRADFPGEVTVRFREEDFPLLWLAARRDPTGNPYRVCTLDYSVAGRRVRVVADQPDLGLRAGAEGTAIVEATVDVDRHVRVQLDSKDAPVNLPFDAVLYVVESADG